MTQHLYIRTFIIGSSIPVVLPFLLSVQKLGTEKNYTYETYTIIAPLYFGIMNMISLYIKQRFTLTDRQRYVLIGVISPCLVVMFARLSKSYNFTPTEWIQYTIRLSLVHFMTWNIVIYSLEQLV